MACDMKEKALTISYKRNNHNLVDSKKQRVTVNAYLRQQQITTFAVKFIDTK